MQDRRFLLIFAPSTDRLDCNCTYDRVIVNCATEVLYCLEFLLLLLGNTNTLTFFNVYFRNVLIENFIPPEEKNKIMNRLCFDSEEDQWRLRSILPERSVDHFHM